MKKRHQQFLLSLCLIALIISILLLTLLPAPIVRPVRKYIRIKTGHRIAYAVLSVVLVFFLKQVTKFRSRYAYIYTLLLATIFGALLEAGQYITATREGDIYDIVINFTGVLAGLLCAYSIEQFIKNI